MAITRRPNRRDWRANCSMDNSPSLQVVCVCRSAFKSATRKGRYVVSCVETKIASNPKRSVAFSLSSETSVWTCKNLFLSECSLIAHLISLAFLQKPVIMSPSPPAHRQSKTHRECEDARSQKRLHREPGHLKKL